MIKIFSYFKNFFDLFFPDICPGCETHLFEQEEIVCTQCLYDIPKTNFHLEKNNPVAQIFYGRVLIHKATAFYFFRKKGILQKLIHNLKYKKDKLVGFILGKQMAIGLKHTEFVSADIIVPVPLHPKKLLKRGYNQSEWIVKGMLDFFNAKISHNNLYRAVNTDSQTRKSRFDRWTNVSDIFKIRKPEEFRNKHILLVDDIVTTGSTIEACAAALLKIKGCKVSVVCLAIAVN